VNGKVTPEVVLAKIREGAPFAVATVIEADDGGLLGAKVTVALNGAIEGSTGVAGWDEAIVAKAPKVIQTGPEILRLAGGAVFIDPLLPTPRLLICGAGHIALPLARFGLELGYEVTVIDDREDFASPSRFPGCRTIAGEFAETLEKLEYGRGAHVVVITRGHVHDVDCLKVVLPKETAYVGLIGSRRRVGFVKKELLAGGIGAERVEELHTPIGLAIGAETPAELAISILAEITAVRRLGDARNPHY